MLKTRITLDPKRKTITIWSPGGFKLSTLFNMVADVDLDDIENWTIKNEVRTIERKERNEADCCMHKSGGPTANEPVPDFIKLLFDAANITH